MADWVKYCPKCGAENKGHRSACKCGEDLRNVPKVPKGSTDVPQPPEKKKICPVCLTVNSAKSAACSCGADLGSVLAIPADKVEDELKKLKDERGKPQTPKEEVHTPTPAPQQPESENVRLCPNLDCNHINTATQRQCEKCGTFITEILTRQKAEAEVLRRAQEAKKQTPPKPQAKRKAVSVRLVADDGFTYDMKPGKITVGRQNTMMEYLRPMLWVGRQHAELNFEDGVLTVQDLDSENHTYVNGKRVRSGEVRELADGDVLGLGDSRKDTQDSQAAFFRIELR